MARAFVAASSQYLERTASVPITAPPLTISAWMHSTSLTVNQTVLQIQDKDVESHGFTLQALGAFGGDPVRFAALDGGSGAADTSISYTINTWHHVCGIETSSTSRAAFIDGGNKGTDTDSITPAGLDSVSIGRRGDSTPGPYFDGYIAEVAIWNASLSDPEVAILALGYSPLLIRPQNLVAYWPLIGRTSPEIDIVGGFDLTLFSSPTTIAHPPMFYPTQPITLSPPSSGTVYVPRPAAISVSSLGVITV